mmetsp:Transcript_2480/g.7613  ORF Transcript_2480/g.7613 Transcript_2480/m.7613 type:complete len:343 (+) Transcript_2480:244-1272(+)
MPRHKSSGWLAPRRVTPSAVQRQSFSSASRAPGRAALAGAALRRVDRAEAPDGVRDEGERHGEGVLHLAGGSQRRVQAAEAVARVEAQRRDVRCPQPRSDRVWEVDKVLQRHAGRPARVHHPVAPPAGEVAGAGVEDVAEADAVVVAASRRDLAFDGGETLRHAGVDNLVWHAHERHDAERRVDRPSGDQALDGEAVEVLAALLAAAGLGERRLETLEHVPQDDRKRLKLARLPRRQLAPHVDLEGERCISADGGGLADRPEDREEAGKEDDPVQDGEADHDTRSHVEQHLRAADELQLVASVRQGASRRRRRGRWRGWRGGRRRRRGWRRRRGRRWRGRRW